MSCRRVSRELLERFRFGEELDARSDPHLAHLQACGACREAVGLDRALVNQLRRALRARVEGASPSARSWDAVRERALAADAPRPRLALAWRWVRLAPMAAAMTLMLFAVAVGQDAERPAAIQLSRWQDPQQLPAPEPGWEMPWWLAARTGPPPAPKAHGPLDMTSDDSARITRAGPFSESVE
jgi:anti-sigma factor RsiW